MSGFFLAAAPRTLGVNASPDLIELQQPDGAKINLYIRGDEYMHWFEDERGFTVVLDKALYVYATSNRNGELVPTTLVVGRVDPASVGLAKGLRPSARAIRDARINALPPAERSSAISGAGENVTSPSSVAPIGTVKNLVILCKFSDHVFGTHTRPQTEYDVLFNKIGGDPTLAPTGSVRDYYKETSYGTIDLQSTVVGWVTLPQTEAYYAGTNAGRGSYPQNGQGMVEDALKLVDPLINFGAFDANNDGFIDAITVIHSGYAAETGGGGGLWIWSHKWALWPLPGGSWVSNDTNANGINVKVYDYHTEAALWSTSGTDIARIGVICHETGHFFGLPDLYDTDNTSFGIGSYCVMANSWGFDGSQHHPPHFSAWCKLQLGWVSPTIIGSGTFNTLQVETNKSIYRINNGFPNGEYLLIENRQPIGFESILPQGGLAIWHIDESKPDNKAEGFPGQVGWPGNNNHYKVALLQADGLYNLEHSNNRGDSGDVYRGGGQSFLNTTTVPNTNSYQGGIIVASNNSITNIGPSGPTITFTLNASVTNFTITTSSSPSNGGTTSGGGTFASGSNATVTATPNAGFTFTNWTQNGSPVSSSASYTFTVSGNRTLVANFTANPINYTVTTSSSPSNGGTTSGGGTFASGSNVTVFATASSGFVFNNWTETGNVVSSSASYTFALSANRTLVANFIPSSTNYTISTSSSPSNGGTTSGGGTFAGGTSRTVAAVANSGFTFANWTENGNVVSTLASYTFTLNGNRALVANFAANALNYTVATSSSPSNGGTTSGGGTYASGASVTVIATANSGFSFTNWTENGNVVSTLASYTFTISGNRTLVANFSASGGNQANLTPYQPSGWSDKIVVSNVIGTSTDNTNLQPTNTLYVDWAVINNGTVDVTASFNIELYVDGIFRTSWTASPPTSANFYRFIQDYNLGSLSAGTHTLRIKADPANAVAEGNEGDNEYTKTITIGSNDNFINRQAISGNSGTITGSNVGATKESGEPSHAGSAGGRSIWYSWTAPASGSVTFDTFQSAFDTLLGIYTGSSVNSLNLIANNDDANGTFQSSVTFQATAGVIYQIAIDGYNGAAGNTVLHWLLTPQQTYTISVNASPSSGGTVSGGGTFASGASVAVTAIANSGFTFANWTENGNVVSTASSYTFTATSNRTLTANFNTTGAQPNLIPFQPAGWADKIVVSTVPGTSTDGINLLPTNTLYIDWAVLNSSTANINASFVIELYVDGVLRTFWTASPPTSANFYRYVEDYNLGPLSAGTHTLRIKADATNAVGESNEVDNEYTKTINIGSNDNFANGQLLSGNSGTATGSNVGATKEAGEPIHAANVGGASIWYSWTAPVSGPATFDTFQSNFDTLLAVYTGSSVNSLNLVASNDDSPTGGFQSSLTFNAVSGVTYRIAIDGYNSEAPATGNTVLHWLLTQQQTYTVSVSALPNTGGTVSGGGTFASGASVTVTGTANSGFIFANWTENGNVVSTSANYTFTLNGNRTLVANFSASGGNQPNLAPYQPTGWSDEIVVSNVSGTNTDRASLLPTDTLYIDWAVLNGGSGNINTSFTVELYVDGVFRAFWTASPPTNANFYRYVEDYNLGSLAVGTHTLRIKADSTNAVGESNEGDNEYTKTITIGSNDNFINREILAGSSGTATGTNVGTTKESGEPLHAGNVGGASIWYSWTAPASGTTTFDTFQSGFDTLLAVYTGNAVNGLNVVTSNDDAPTGGRQSIVTFNASAGVTYQIAIDGYGGVTGNTMLHWLLAQQQTYTITTSSSPSNGGTTSGGGTFAGGTSRTVTAVANSGFNFVNWTESGNVVSTVASYTFTLNGNRTLVANFNANPVPVPTPTISVRASPAVVAEGGTAQFIVSATTVNPSQPVTVFYGMSSKALRGADYTLTEPFGQVTIPPGASTAPVTLNALRDSLKEKSEKAIMTLRAGAGYKLPKSKKATITITNVQPTPTPSPTPTPTPSPTP